MSFVATVPPERIRERVNTGQTRYQELLEELDVTEDELDPVLMDMAKAGDVSLIANRSVLNVRG